MVTLSSCSANWKKSASCSAAIRRRLELLSPDFCILNSEVFMKDAVIVSAVRTAVGKAPKGTLRNTRPDEMGGAVIKEALARVPGLDAAEIEDVIMGCAMPEAEQGMNVARAAAIRAGLPVETSAMT